MKTSLLRDPKTVEPQKARPRRAPRPEDPKANYKEAEKKTPGEFTGPAPWVLVPIWDSFNHQ